MAPIARLMRGGVVSDAGERTAVPAGPADLQTGISAPTASPAGPSGPIVELTIQGNFTSEVLSGGTAGDTISGGEGADLISGRGGNDTIYGFADADLAAGSGLIAATRVASGLDNPIYAVSPPGDPNRLYIVEQHTGQIEILDLATGQIAATPFLDIPDNQLAGGNEQGLLGLAFDPDYATNGKFYVNFTDAAGDTQVREFTRSANPDVANAASARNILSIPHPFDNHNGGWMDFGPDGYLYIATGDGGSGGDPGNNAQNLNSLLGKILRIDPSLDAFPNDPARNYAIPAGNPFAGIGGADEIFAYGLRNPWRNSIDNNGDIWIADVGQGAREEVNYIPAGQLAGLNFGWKVKEGTVPYDTTIPGNPPVNDPSLYDPLLDYPHTDGPYGGIAVTGGYVYRGPGGATGNYVFADFSGNLWTVRQSGGTAINFENRNDQLATDAGAVGLIASFAEDGQGRLYVIGLGGDIHRLTPSAAAGDSADRLVGADGNDRLYGGTGNDRLEGGAGTDILAGGIGNDLYVLTDSLDQIVEAGGSGSDRVLTAASYSLANGISIEILQANGAAATTPINLSGNAFDQTIFANGAQNVIKGGAGADRLYGYAARDFISPGNDNSVDYLFYLQASDSTGSTRDEITDIDLNEDKIVVPGKVNALLAEIKVGKLNGISFNEDLAAAVDPVFTPDGQVQAVLFDPSSGNQNVDDHKYVVIDLNNDGRYLAGDDLVLELVSAAGTLTRDDFI